MAQSVAHMHGKHEVAGSIPAVGLRETPREYNSSRVLLYDII